MKWDQKFKNKFFSPFEALYLTNKQVYKLKLQTMQKIYDFFHISLLEQDIIKKGISQ